MLGEERWNIWLMILSSVRLTFVPHVVMLNPIKRYTHWLHTCWPAGVVEKLPESGEFGVTNIPGTYRRRPDRIPS